MSPTSNASPARRTALIGAVALVLAVTAEQTPSGQSSPAQSPDVPVFRIGVRYVEIDVIVRDREGQVLRGLTKEDFILREDMKVQTVDRAQFVDLPSVSPSAPGPEQSFTVSDTPPAGAPDDRGRFAGRICVLVIGSPEREAVAIGQHFVDRYLGPSDLMGVVHVYSSAANLALTSDKARLRAAIAGRPQADAGRAQADVLSLPGTRDPYSVLKDVAVNLSAVTGRRKSIIYVGEGEQLWTNRDASATRQKWNALTDATRTAAGYRVPIHTIGLLPSSACLRGQPGGLSPGDTTPFQPQKCTASALYLGPPSFEANPPPLSREPGGVVGDDYSASIRLLSEDTGGIDVGPLALDKGFRRIAEENNHYYVLGYYSDAERDGKYHTVNVEVRHPGAVVQGRRGFRAPALPPKGKTVGLPRGLSSVARDLLKAESVQAPPLFQTSVVMFRGQGDDASLLVHTFVEGQDLPFGGRDKVQVTAAAVDPAGRIRAVADRSFSVTPDEQLRTRIDRHGVSFLSRLTVPYGNYEIRVIAQLAGRLLGRSTTVVEVPDFAEHNLLFSDLLVTAATKAPVVLLPDPELRRGLPTAPLFIRRFTRDDLLGVYGEIYDTHWLLSPQLGVRWHVTSDAGTVVAEGAQQIVSTDGRAFFTGSVPLKRFEPGAYTLEVDAFTVAGQPAAASRQLQFEVLPAPLTAVAGGAKAAVTNATSFQTISLRRAAAACAAFSLSTRCVEERTGPGTVRLRADGSVEATSAKLATLVGAAFDLPPSRVRGGPSWAETEQYDLLASPGSSGTASSGRRMLRALLQERFRLETRPGTMSARMEVMRRTGPTLSPLVRPSARDCVSPIDGRPPEDVPELPRCPDEERADGRLISNVTMAELASNVLSTGLVIDQTGLQGRYDVTIPGSFAGNRLELRQQLGLRIEVEPRQIETVVITGATRPVDD